MRRNPILSDARPPSSRRCCPAPLFFLVSWNLEREREREERRSACLPRRLVPPTSHPYNKGSGGLADLRV